jgi:glycosyltransferase involved in cell wall biosynthesis
VSPTRTLPTYVLITPARNEEANIERTIRSVIAQTVVPLKWIIVDDCSTDSTGSIARRYAGKFPWIEVLRMPPREGRSFAAKAHAFKAGFERVAALKFEVVGNLDADLSFEADYFEFLMQKFAGDPSLGVAGTIFHEEGFSSDSHSFEGQQHVAGGAQMFRRECFEAIGGYVPNPAGGVDWIAVTTARMHGWKTRSFREKAFFHHRSLGTAERGPLGSAFSYGQKDYYLGNAPTWEIFRIGYQLMNRPYLLGGTAMALGYMMSALRRAKRPVSDELMQFHRAEQLAKLKAILKTALQLRRMEKYPEGAA